MSKQCGVALCYLILLGLVLVPVARTSPLRVVTTVAPITDMTRQVGGDRIDVHGLVPEGVNSHTFRPTPHDVRHLATADLIILNGLYLEIPTEKLARKSAKPEATILMLGDQATQRADWAFDLSFPKAEGHPNPHLWLNVAFAMRYVQLIQDQISRLDPTHATSYADNAARYLRQLDQLDRCAAKSIATIPLANRKLLTYHDSWPYFAKRYGMQIIGAVQPASFSTPSARDVARLIRQIQQSSIPAIFGSEVFPSKVLAKIAAETHVTYVNSLRDDVLPGSTADAAHSYIGMMQANIRAMTRALGGEGNALESCLSTLVTQKE